MGEVEWKCNFREKIMLNFVGTFKTYGMLFICHRIYLSDVLVLFLNASGENVQEYIFFAVIYTHDETF